MDDDLFAAFEDDQPSVKKPIESKTEETSGATE